LRRGRSGAVLVTGAGSGIGQALAIDLAAHGITVVAGVRAVGQAPRSREGDAAIHEIILDVTVPEHIDRLSREVRTAIGAEPLLALVNNAGIGVGGPLEFVGLDDLRRQFEVNVVGQVAVTQAVLELLRAHGQARIVFVGSIGSRVAAPFFGPYAASKSAIDAIADSWRGELSPWNIRVSVLTVAPAATPIWTKASTTLAELRRRLPSRARDLYGGPLASMARYVDERVPASAIDVGVVVRAARRAVVGGRPRRRYLVGTETRAGVVLSALLPARIFDAILRARTR
jgi:NAD(P)-dependent dehydrogenase (short-subunit alcohol dehydrogenase family)